MRKATARNIVMTDSGTAPKMNIEATINEVMTKNYNKAKVSGSSSRQGTP
jgi:hypothetical protein